jgi:hypothetical protein
MRKQILDSSLHNTAAQGWLDLQALAQVQVTSEQATNPIELALIPTEDELATSQSGWQAAQPGEQTIRLLFDKPQNIELIQLLFRETKRSRTQEFSLRYSTDQGASYHPILRQQYNFSPPSSCLQREDYQVQLQAVTILELSIRPDISGGSCLASLASLRLA